MDDPIPYSWHTDEELERLLVEGINSGPGEPINFDCIRAEARSSREPVSCPVSS